MHEIISGSPQFSLPAPVLSRAELNIWEACVKFRNGGKQNQHPPVESFVFLEYAAGYRYIACISNCK